MQQQKFEKLCKWLLLPLLPRCATELSLYQTRQRCCWCWRLLGLLPSLLVVPECVMGGEGGGCQAVCSNSRATLEQGVKERRAAAAALAHVRDCLDPAPWDAQLQLARHARRWEMRHHQAHRIRPLKPAFVQTQQMAPPPPGGRTRKETPPPKS